MVDRQGLEPRTDRLWAGCSTNWANGPFISIAVTISWRQYRLLAPPVGFEPTTLRLTAACSTCWAKEAKAKGLTWLPNPSCWHWPIFPVRLQTSIFGTGELNFRVRNGNGWTLTVKNTNYIWNNPNDTINFNPCQGFSFKRMYFFTSFWNWYTIRDSNPGHPD